MWGLAFVLPALIFFCAFAIYPVVKGLSLSFTMSSVFTTEWVGLQHFREFLSSPVFWKGVNNTLMHVLYTVPIATIGPLVIALIVARSSEKYHNFLRFAFYVPGLTAGVIMAAVWIFMTFPASKYVTTFKKLLSKNFPGQ